MFTGRRWLVRTNDKRPRLHRLPEREADEDGVYGLRLQLLAIDRLPGHTYLGTPRHLSKLRAPV